MEARYNNKKLLLVAELRDRGGDEACYVTRMGLLCYRQRQEDTRLEVFIPEREDRGYIFMRRCEVYADQVAYARALPKLD